jgi:ATP-binding cassette subfamily F protein 3
MTGEIEPDSGLVERQRRTRYACLAQIPDVSPNTTIFDAVLHSFDEILSMERRLGELEALMGGGDESVLPEYSELQDQFTIRGGYDFRLRISQVLHGLGFHTGDFELPFHVLSGGQRTRLMLALVLLQDADLLLLDEPENHLDLEAREWLEEYLTSCRASVVIISHDRRMLNAVCSRIVEIERSQVRSYSGNYDAYQKDKALIREQQMKAFERHQEHLRKEQAFIDKFRYKATKARQVQSRIKRLEKLETVEAPLAETATANFNLGEVVRSGAVVLQAKHLTMGYDNLPLYSEVNFEVHRGERVGIIGPNGTGKTTLLRQVAGQHAGLAGEIVLGNKVRPGYYDQHHDTFNPAADILTEVQSAQPQLTAEQVRSFMGKFLFVGDEIFKPVKALSGGERSRVAMAKLILSGANLLLLDEPTNHLDIASREALELALSEFQGAIIMISHDRALIDRLVDKLIIIENGRAEVHLGNYTHYRWKVQQAGAAVKEAPKKDPLQIRTRQEKERTKSQERELRKQRKQLETLEAEIEAGETRLQSFEQKFAAIDPADYERAAALKAEYESAKQTLEGQYAEWETLTEALAQES